ncbi:MAG: CARDB domain-containing protein [Ezakiella sp.]|nr:CARDB domain-containing protein [Ezakiella sp.]
MRKYISLLLVVFLSLSMVNIYATGEEPGAIDRPNVRLDGDTYIEAEPGDTVDVRVMATLSFDRDGRYDYDYIVSGNLETAETQNIYIKDGHSELSLRPYDYRKNRYYDRYSNRLEDTAGLNFRVSVPDNAKAGNYVVTSNIFVNGQSAGKLSTTIRVTRNGEAAYQRLELSEVSVYPNMYDIKPGSMVVASVTVKNPTKDPVYNAQVRLEGMKDGGFTLLKDYNTRTIEVLYPGEKKDFLFELGSTPNIKTGNYEFTVSLEDPNNQGKETPENKRSFFLTVNQSPDSQSALIIENLVVPKKTLYPGNTATISFDLRNQGQSEARRVMVKSKVDGSGLVARTVSQFFEATIAPGEVKHYEFTYYASPASTTQNYPISFSVEYFDQYSTEDKPLATEQVAGLFVSNPEKDNEGKDKKPSTPKLIIEKYSFEPQLPEAGTEFTMTLNFKNTHAQRTVKNIKIQLSNPEKSNPQSNTAGSNIFTPIDSSNTFFIDQIAPGGTVEKKIRFSTVPDATAKTYEINADFEYEDDKNNEFKSTESIGIPVIQQSRLEVDQIQTENNFMAGNGTSLSTTFYNTGKVTLYNMMVEVKSDDPSVEIQNGTYFIGNFNMGSTETHDASINSMEPGNKKVKVIYSYEDSAGKKQEVVKEVEYMVSEAPAFDPNDMGEMPQMPEEPQGIGSKIKNLATKWYFWLIIVALAAVILIVLRKIRHRKREKELTLDE